MIKKNDYEKFQPYNLGIKSPTAFYSSFESIFTE